MTKWIYEFEEGNAEMRDLLGGKGANLAEMSRAGLPVPPGFTVTTEACLAYLAEEGFPKGLWEEELAAMDSLNKKMGRDFGDAKDPLLVSVRSGARFSMPGMMDTILNLGLNDQSVLAMAEKTENPRFAWDAYRRLVQMFGKVVLNIDGLLFEELIDDIKTSEGVDADPDVTAKGWMKCVDTFKELIKSETGTEFPQDPTEQLKLATEAVFKSWNSKRAIDYRNATGIDHSLGTAVNIMAMVFGNVGWDSGSGVAFTRNPSTGEKSLYGEFLFNAQGEDVVSGARTPIEINELSEKMPETYQQFADIGKRLETHYRDMQDMEFTIENGKLFMLQTRNGKRTAAAAVNIAVDMVEEGLITKEEAVMRVEPGQIDMLLHPRFDEEALNAAEVLAKGLNASPGAAVGEVVFTADDAERLTKEEGKSVILVRPETTPDDVHGMLTAKGILTQHGGATSHAAVVARQLGTPCVAGCEDIRINLKEGFFVAHGETVKAGDTISLDGATGRVFLGAMPTVAPSFDEQPALKTLLGWADEISRMMVWANADDPDQAIRARSYGAQGIGLCRTEHMFLGERTVIFQKAVLAETEEDFNRVLDEELLPLQREDFHGIFRAMDGLPVIIRLLDPPLHEFLPSRDELIEEVATMRATGKDSGPEFEEKAKLLETANAMHEFNPMLGLRGCRLGLTRPNLNKMQVRAILEAACDAASEGINVHPEIMIPLTSHINELNAIQPLLEEVAEAVTAEKGIEVSYKFGTMIEIPRAALTAGEIAEKAQFFSFGTNDLTQMTYGLSRDDAERHFLLDFVAKGILPENPFQSIDQDGVGALMDLAVKQGRATRPDLEIGICGEHGGEPKSIAFCHKIGLDYVSCSPYRVPIARLAAAQAVVAES